MAEEFGPFARVFEPLEGDNTPYLSLLHLHNESAPAVVQLIRRAAASDNADPFVTALLREPDWRPHLVGAVASFFRRSPPCIQQLWSTLDTGSWVAPQLAAVLSLIDQAFIDHALERLTTGCQLTDVYSFDSPVERHIAHGPAGNYHRSAKNAAALASLLRFDYPSDERLGQLASNSEVAQLITDDFDDSGNIAASWRERLTQMVESA